MSEKMTLNEAITLSITAVQHYGDESAKNKEQAVSVVRHLESMKRFEMNFSALSLAIMNIRSMAQDGCRKDATEQDQIDSLKKIESIADRLHNVPGFMLEGIKYNAFYPNSLATLQNYEGFSLSIEEFEKIKNNKGDLHE